MVTFRQLSARPASTGPTVLVLGNFDGVHRGHQALLAKGAERARALGGRAVALTFDPHPSKLLAPSLAPPLLQTLEQRVAALHTFGADDVWVLAFDRALAQTSPEAFVQDYLVAAGAREVVVGYDFSFGRGRSGSTDDLRALCAGAKIEVHVIPAVCLPGGLVPSSSKVRELVLEGRVEAAAELLGRPFEVVGPVVPGAGRGRTIGVPTANIQAEGELLPAQGVYAVQVRLPGEATPWPGAANLGTNPTFDGARLSLEVHLLDYDGAELYGAQLGVSFVRRLRPERRFSSAEALVAQIRSDLDEARAALHPVQAQ